MIKNRNYLSFLLLVFVLVLASSCSNQPSNTSKEIDAMLKTPFYFEMSGKTVDPNNETAGEENTNAQNAKAYEELLANLDKMTDAEKLNYLAESLEDVIQRHEKGEAIMWDEGFVNQYVKQYFPDLYPTIQQQINDDKETREGNKNLQTGRRQPAKDLEAA